MERGWEHITYGTDRLRVPNGWIVKTQEITLRGNCISVSSIFVEDRGHSWVLDEKKEEIDV